MKKVILVVLMAVFASGCNFFGKKEADPSPPPGVLDNGMYVAGVWTRFYASTSATRNPTTAYTETYFFDPQGSARIEIKDPHYGGILCIGYGQYRTIGNDIFVYMQTANYGFCGFSPVSQLSNVQVSDQAMFYHDNSYDADLVLYRDKTPAIPGPVGLWDFHSGGADPQGNGGFDWIFFTEYGYMVMQTTYDNAQYLLVGTYSVGTNGSLTVTFFDGDPSHPVDPAIVFSQFVTNGAVLDLSETNNSIVTHYIGDRL